MQRILIIKECTISKIQLLLILKLIHRKWLLTVPEKVNIAQAIELLILRSVFEFECSLALEFRNTATSS